MNRLRDAELTEDDYYWLCKLKMSYKSLQETAAFKDAPILMEFRKENSDHPESNCAAYNRRFLYTLSHTTKKPIARIEAYHEGILETEAKDIQE